MRQYLSYSFLVPVRAPILGYFSNFNFRVFKPVISLSNYLSKVAFDLFIEFYLVGLQCGKCLVQNTKSRCQAKGMIAVSSGWFDARVHALHRSSVSTSQGAWMNNMAEIVDAVCEELAFLQATCHTPSFISANTC